MKRLLFIISSILFVSLSAAAQVDSSPALPSSGILNEFSFSGGLSLPSIPREFRKYWKTGFHAGISIGHTFTPGSLGYGGVHAIVDYNNFPFDEEGVRQAKNLRSSTVVDGKSRSMINAMFIFKGSFSKFLESVHPYFLGGIGISYNSSYHASSEGKNLSVPDSAFINLAWLYGLGIDVPANDNLTLFVEAKHFIAATGNWGTQYYPISAGIRIKI
jgi:hypothetical protein